MDITIYAVRGMVSKNKKLWFINKGAKQRRIAAENPTHSEKSFFPSKYVMYIASEEKIYVCQ
jgi:hypothetical protein